MKLKNSRREDILVIGAGIIGLSIALSLEDAGYKVTVVDSNQDWKASPAAAGVLFPTSAERSSGLAGDYSFKALGEWNQFEKRLGGGIRNKNGIIFFEHEDGLKDLDIIAKNSGSAIKELKSPPKYLKPIKDYTLYSLEIKNGATVNPNIILKRLKDILKADFKNDLAKELIIKNNLAVGVQGEKEKYVADKIIIATGANGYN